MRTIAFLALVLLSATGLSCGGEATTPAAPAVDTQLQVFVQWQGRGIADVRLDVLELHLTQTTDSDGITVFKIPAGTYTLRSYVNAGGPRGTLDQTVNLKQGQAEHVQVTDCLPCVSP